MFPEYSLVITARVNTHIQADHSCSRHPSSARPQEALDSGIGRKSFLYLVVGSLLSCCIQTFRQEYPGRLSNNYLHSRTRQTQLPPACVSHYLLSSWQAQTTGTNYLLAALALTPASQLATGNFCCAPHNRPAHLQVAFASPSFLFLSLPFSSSLLSLHLVTSS